MSLVMFNTSMVSVDRQPVISVASAVMVRVRLSSASSVRLASSMFIVKVNLDGKKLEQMIADNSGKPVEEVSRDVERDKILTAEQAVEYCLVDQVLGTMKTPAV